MKLQLHISPPPNQKKKKPLPNTLASRDYNAQLHPKPQNSFHFMLPPPSPHPPWNTQSFVPNPSLMKKKTNKNKQNKQQLEEKQTNKQTNNNNNNNKNNKKTNLQLWRQNLWLWTVALHMCYRRLTLSLTTVDSWLTGVICEVVTPQRPNQDWQAPLQCFSWKLRSVRGFNSWRSAEQTQSPYLDWGNM